MNRFNQLSVCFFLLCAIIGPTKCSGTNAYVYYTDAKCVSGGDIYGTLIYAYDNQRMKGKGFKIKKYNGKCKYFKGGFYDFMYDSYSGGSTSGSFMESGYCIRCNGVVGCTSTRYSCNGFSTIIPNNSYTLSENSSAYNSTNEVTMQDYDGTITDDEDMYNYMEEAEEEIYQQLYRSQNSAFYSICGALFGASVMLVGTIFRSRGRRLDSSFNISMINKADIDKSQDENVYHAEETS